MRAPADPEADGSDLSTPVRTPAVGVRGVPVGGPFWSGLLWMRCTVPNLAQGSLELKQRSKCLISGKGFFLS